MPQFLDIFTEQVRAKRGTIGQKIDVGRVSELDEELKDLIEKNWYRIVDVGAPEMEVVAVDGSLAKRTYASGAILYITRALAVYGKKRFRELEVDSFLSKAPMGEVKTFVTRKMEWLEFKVAMKAVEEAELTNIALLMDGSLYGGLTHLPGDQPADGMKGFMVDYFETFSKLLDLCRKRNILILGVSKDSRSSFLRNFLLRSLFNEEISKAKGLSGDDRVKLTRIFEGVFVDPLESVNVFKELKNVYGEGLRKVEGILHEAVAARSDHQLIWNYMKKAGHTIPLELSYPKRGEGRLKKMQTDPLGYVRKHFKEAILESNDQVDFVKRASGVISKIPHFPSMVSFHVLLDRRDTPLRVDTPSWTFKRDHEVEIADLKEERILLLNVNEIVSLLLRGYGGLKDYNVWLKTVDEEVRLRRDSVDEIYIPALEKLEGVKGIYARGYRRVKYL